MEKLGTILLIDDDAISCYLNQQLLLEMGIFNSIVCITDGQEALEYLKMVYPSASEGVNDCPDLIFLDLNMPGLDGFQVMDQLSEMGGSKGLVIKRVVILSTSMHPVDQERAGKHEVFDYLVKPLTETKLKGVIDHFLQSQVPGSKNQNKLADPQIAKDRLPIKRSSAERVKKRPKKLPKKKGN